MQIHITPPTDHRVRLIVGIVLVMILTVAVLGWGTRSAAEGGPGTAAAQTPMAQPSVPTTVLPSSPAPTGTSEREGEQAVVTDVLAAVEAATPIIVPAPRPGDLRVDPEADALPADYVPSPATSTELDVAYGPDDAHHLDLFLPAGDAAPAIVFLHPGGWVGGTKDALPDMVLRFVERGYAVASIDYRLAPEHPFPAAVHDTKRAVRWIKAYGALTGAIDPNRVVVYGTSAGGHLASFVAATPGDYEPDDLPSALAAFDSSVVATVSMVGPTDLEALYVQDHPWARPLTTAFAGCDPCDPAQLQEPSTLHQLHADLPPAYWGYGGIDALVDADSQGRVIAEAWAEHAGPESSWLDIVEEHGHNLNETLVNQRTLEAFIDAAVGHDPA